MHVRYDPDGYKFFSTKFLHCVGKFPYLESTLVSIWKILLESSSNEESSFFREYTYPGSERTGSHT